MREENDEKSWSSVGLPQDDYFCVATVVQRETKPMREGKCQAV